MANRVVFNPAGAKRIVEAVRHVEQQRGDTSQRRRRFIPSSGGDGLVRCIVDSWEQVFAYQWRYRLQHAHLYLGSPSNNVIEWIGSGPFIEEAYNVWEPVFNYQVYRSDGGPTPQAVTTGPLPKGYPVLARLEPVPGSGDPSTPPPSHDLTTVPRLWGVPKPGRVLTHPVPGSDDIGGVWTFWALNPLNVNCDEPPAPKGLLGRFFG